MKRFHVHVRVNNLAENIDFYSALFNHAPSVTKPDYAKWMLEDPRINFAISTGHTESGIEHLGFQVETADELADVYTHMNAAKGAIREEGNCACCYAKSEKSWITDPQGVDWEVFRTYGEHTVYGEGINARPAPDAMANWSENEKREAKIEVKKPARFELPIVEKACCS